AVRKDQKAVARLALDANLDEMISAAPLVVLVKTMISHKLDPSPLLGRARSRFPTDFDLAFTLGTLLDWKRSEAITPYAVARAVRPDNLPALNNLVYALLAGRNATEAVAAGRELVRLAPEGDFSHLALGLALAEAGDRAGAFAEIRTVIRLNPDNSRAHSSLCRELVDAGEWDAAMIAGQEAVRLDPKNAKAHNNLGTALAGRKHFPQAIAAFKKAIELAPNYANAHHNLSKALYDSKDLPGAVAAAKAAV